MYRVFKDRRGMFVFRSPASRECDTDFDKLHEKVIGTYKIGSIGRWLATKAFDDAAAKYGLK